MLKLESWAFLRFTASALEVGQQLDRPLPYCPAWLSDPLRVAPPQLLGQLTAERPSARDLFERPPRPVARTLLDQRPSYQVAILRCF